MARKKTRDLLELIAAQRRRQRMRERMAGLAPPVLGPALPKPSAVALAAHSYVEERAEVAQGQAALGALEPSDGASSHAKARPVDG